MDTVKRRAVARSSKQRLAQKLESLKFTDLLRTFRSLESRHFAFIRWFEHVGTTAIQSTSRWCGQILYDSRHHTAFTFVIQPILGRCQKTHICSLAFGEFGNHHFCPGFVCRRLHGCMILAEAVGALNNLFCSSKPRHAVPGLLRVV